MQHLYTAHAPGDPTVLSNQITLSCFSTMLSSCSCSISAWAFFIPLNRHLILCLALNSSSRFSRTMKRTPSAIILLSNARTSAQENVWTDYYGNGLHNMLMFMKHKSKRGIYRMMRDPVTNSYRFNSLQAEPWSLPAYPFVHSPFSSSVDMTIQSLCWNSHTNRKTSDLCC